MTLPTRPTQTPPTGDVQVDGAPADQQMQDQANTVAAGGAPSNLTSTQQATANDDWSKVASWDVTDASGQPVTTLDQLAEVLGTDRTTAAGALLNSPMGAAAPPELAAEAEQEVNPQNASLANEFDDVAPQAADGAGFDDQADDETDEAAPDDEFAEEDPGTDDPEATDPEDIADGGADEDTEDESDDKPAFLKGKSLPRAGSLVSWAGMRGRVEMMVTNGGTVPGVTDGLVGTKNLPVARVRLYEQRGAQWVPTDRRTAVLAKHLRLMPQGGMAAPQTRDVPARLVLKVAQHAGPAGSGKPTAESIREVYRRGQEAWPGETKTALSSQEWALGRVQAFIDKSEGYDIEHYVGDDDLLP